MPEKRFHHYWPFVREVTTRVPSQRVGNAEYGCLLAISFKAPLNKQSSLGDLGDLRRQYTHVTLL